MVARFLVALCFAAAALVLTGWAIDNEALRHFGLPSVTMNPATACLFLMLSVGIALRETGRPGWAVVAGALFAAVGAAGALKLLDVVAGTDSHIDSFIFASKLSAGYARPSRMAPNAALCFVMISLAIAMMRSRAERAVIAAQALVFLTTVIGIFAFVGHLYSVGSFYTVAAFHPMALHTAGVFLCFSGFVLIRTAKRGLMIPVSDQGPAGRTSRSLLPAAAALPVVLGWLRQRGEMAGFYPADIGIALMVVLTIVTMTALIWQNAYWLLAADRRRLAAEAVVAHMAAHDFLTGLANRARFMDRLMARIAASHRGTTGGFAIISMDLDGFKQVNDRLGHAAGDALLREVGLHLKRCSLREDDLVARVGGDEFAMLLGNVSATGDAMAIAARIVADMPKQFGPAGSEVAIGISVGIVVAGRPPITPEALLAEADEALYHVKRTGKGRFSLHPQAA